MAYSAFQADTALSSCACCWGEHSNAIPVRSQSVTLEHLTARQRETLWLLSYGLPNKMIARRMTLSEATVKAHISAILLVTGCSNRTQAALIGMALREGQPTAKLSDG